jgi:hypothetical protein
MSPERSKLYLILFIACVAGYIWLFYGISTDKFESESIALCPFKVVTNIPCPSCGSTRSVVLLLKGKFIEALYVNPLGLLVALIMLFAPVWIIFDLLFKKRTLLNFYNQMETNLRKPLIAIPFVLLIIINWIWNITKEL